jgi:membrane-bound lytic murein transglycosylase B
MISIRTVLRPFAAVGLLLLGTGCADYTDRDDVQAYMAEISAEHHFPPEELERLFSQATRQSSILEAIARPAERTLKWHEYREIFLQEPRVEQGLQFWNDNEEALQGAWATYGVPPEYVVAIIGVETRYGQITGGYRVLDALTTLTFDYPPRAPFFRKELTEFLLLAREEGRDPLELKGSYAGAMGYGQFIPSSFRSYAVDFDEDGTRDIWSNTWDAIGSVANYFARHGWQPNGEVVRLVTVAGTDADDVANQSLELGHTVDDLRGLGVEIDGLDGAEPAALFRMELADGAEYWLGLNNFYVITRYNRSRLYALAVHQLAQAIRGRREGLTAES